MTTAKYLILLIVLTFLSRFSIGSANGDEFKEWDQDIIEFDQVLMDDSIEIPQQVLFDEPAEDSQKEFLGPLEENKFDAKLAAEEKWLEEDLLKIKEDRPLVLRPEPKKNGTFTASRILDEIHLTILKVLRPKDRKRKSRKKKKLTPPSEKKIAKAQKPGKNQAPLTLNKSDEIVGGSAPLFTR